MPEENTQNAQNIQITDIIDKLTQRLSSAILQQVMLESQVETANRMVESYEALAQKLQAEYDDLEARYEADLDVGAERSTEDSSG